MNLKRCLWCGIRICPAPLPQKSKILLGMPKSLVCLSTSLDTSHCQSTDPLRINDEQVVSLGCLPGLVFWWSNLKLKPRCWRTEEPSAGLPHSPAYCSIRFSNPFLYTKSKLEVGRKQRKAGAVPNHLPLLTWHYNAPSEQGKVIWSFLPFPGVQHASSALGHFLFFCTQHTHVSKEMHACLLSLALPLIHREWALVRAAICGGIQHGAMANTSAFIYEKLG